MGSKPQRPTLSTSITRNAHMITVSPGLLAVPPHLKQRSMIQPGTSCKRKHRLQYTSPSIQINCVQLLSSYPSCPAIPLLTLSYPANSASPLALPSSCPVILLPSYPSCPAFPLAQLFPLPSYPSCPVHLAYLSHLLNHPSFSCPAISLSHHPAIPVRLAQLAGQEG